MPEIIFKIDKNQDAKNWRRVESMANPPYGLSKKKSNNKKIKDFSEEEIKKLEKKKKQLEKYFEINKLTIFSSVKELTNKQIYTKIFYASFTRQDLCHIILMIVGL